MIEIQGATKIYSRKAQPALSNLDLEMNNGEILGLVGLNGAGKTTTIRMTSGIIFPTSGKVMVDGFDIVKQKVKAARNVGWIPEFPNFEPNAKPLPLMKYFAGYYGMKSEEANKKIMDLLEKISLKPYLNRKLRNYSQGMKKRFAIAESIVGDPQNVLFDETLNGLDPEGVLFVRNLMFELRKQGKAILLSSHILSEVEDVADRVAIIDHGKLIKVLKRNELKSLGKLRVHLQIENFNDQCKALLSEYGEVEVDESEIVLRDTTIQYDQVSVIPEKLVNSGYRIRKFDPVGESLEDYFFELIGVKK